MIAITECPRDAMQGIKQWIPTQLKIDYINQLLRVGFDRIDFGSFVSPKAIPQMQDTAQVLKGLDLRDPVSRLLAIIANARGAEEASNYDEISFLGFPFSISETFQKRNTNSTIEESLSRVQAIQSICERKGKQLLVYISMAFGNPYGDRWHPDVAVEWCRRLNQLGIRHFALADTVGTSNEQSIRQLFGAVLPELAHAEVGAHLHSVPEESLQKIRAAYEAGCRRFDVAIHGYGGCPMAADQLTGNIATQALENYTAINKISTGLNEQELHRAYDASDSIFKVYH